MKRILAVAAIVLIIAIFSVSCGSTKICPAYSSNDIEQTSADEG